MVTIPGVVRLVISEGRLSSLNTPSPLKSHSYAAIVPSESEELLPAESHALAEQRNVERLARGPVQRGEGEDGGGYGVDADSVLYRCGHVVGVGDSEGHGLGAARREGVLHARATGRGSVAEVPQEAREAALSIRGGRSIEGDRLPDLRHVRRPPGRERR
jgi:hypothetical protein